ncbi:MAG TPA: hypothetical protein PK156_41255 [Polyangium sp.]|nr:hypothetical protein [Polyangium sp.]
MNTEPRVSRKTSEKSALAKKAVVTKKASPKKSSTSIKTRIAHRSDIQSIPFRTTYIDARGTVHDVKADKAFPHVEMRNWFAVTIEQPITRRFVHVVQVEETTGKFVLYMCLDCDAVDDERIRLPQTGAHVRALVSGPLRVLGADTELSYAEIEFHCAGGTREPQPSPSKSPFV